MIPEKLHQEYCTKIADISIIFIRFIFSQKKLVFKFNPGFTGTLDSFWCNFFTLYFLVIDILRILIFI